MGKLLDLIKTCCGGGDGTFKTNVQCVNTCCNKQTAAVADYSMESSSFYITLPSNASTDYYPDNKASTYQIRMPRTMYLSGNYEVALAEIQYPHTWSTLRPNLEYYVICYSNHSAVDIRTTLYMPQGYYRTANEFIQALNKVIKDLFTHDELSVSPVRLTYNKITRKVSLIAKDDYALQFSTGLAELLGFEQYIMYEDHTEARHMFDIRHGFYTLYVYCSICEPQVVGDYYVPLLRSIGIQGQDGDIVMKTYEEPQYVPVNTSKFDTIEINIKDDTGENVAFKTGKVICKLHFRPKAL